MGRVMRGVMAAGLAAVIGAVSASAVAAFDGLGSMGADSTYDVEIRFEVDLAGGAPERLELLIRTPANESSFVVPVAAEGSSATYVWDTSSDYVTPNTLITYQWRATDGEDVTVSEEGTVRYEDDREGLDWQRAQLGEATVHWYGGAEAQALRFGELTSVGVERAEEFLGTQLAGPVDVFVYETRDDFFGALGPGTREWTGAAAYSELRTIFMWLGGGSASYLETAMVHEVTHVVFFDATDNPYHEPARWLNEGVATWLENREAVDERSIVEIEASGAGLFAFDAITEQFPIGERGGRLSYAQGTTMIDLIVDRYGIEAIARIMAAYRDGASDVDALEAGTGIGADELYAEYFAAYGVDAPQPVAGAPIPASNVERPVPGEIDRGGVDSEPSPGPDSGPDSDPDPDTETPASDAGPGGNVTGSTESGVLAIWAVMATLTLGAALVGARRATRSKST